MFLKILLCLAVIITVCAPASGQDKAVLTKLLKSEEAATALISELTVYSSKSPWSTNAIWSLTQKLAVKGLRAPQIKTAIVASGEMSAALDGDDQLFASVVWFTADLLKQKDPEIVLYELEAIGVPAFDMLGELLRRTPADVRKLASQGRLNSPVVFEALTTAYTLRYNGMAEQLAKKRAAN